MTGVTPEQMADIIRECRDFLSSEGGLLPESHGVCVGGPLHGELRPISLEQNRLSYGDLTYHRQKYEFEDETLMCWRMDGILDTEARAMLLAIIPQMYEEALEAL